MADFLIEFDQGTWYQQGRGPRYKQLCRHISGLVASGSLLTDDQLPSERDIAEIAKISRVTVRKAIADLVADGLIEQRQGAGSFVRGGGERFEQSLSSLVSFTENLQARGIVSTSEVLLTGVFRPTPTEATVLGLSSHHQVARVHRLRRGDGVPMALEHSTLPEDILPRPDKIGLSLYELLRARSNAPVRAIQRVTAVNAPAPVAKHLDLTEGAAVLQIERTAFLASGRPIEFTSGFYRSDAYDFVSELRLD
ncbi:GntR family transcriptional regulator [Octadecabacter ascidiaceicola]|uniref:HTH-type transcriptional repressor YvoA n=1 Tax=Octadecabacter ascidiaceicola TaxID=1655543 RepID=A0A238KRY2_9RHOB|nr:GntR family transcriptional regulator [Octadecabacter ascidiaceicola]SMX44796.1 HTH-type transcriptional repressor YvoA [Octadecabacter ascidiaceicola]